MEKVIFEICTYFLALYGLACIIISFVSSIRQKLGNESSRVKMVLIVKNQEKTIEGIIRNIFMGDILRKIMSNEKLTIVDMNSNDETIKIAQKLKKNYHFFDIIEDGEKDSIFASFTDSI